MFDLQKASMLKRASAWLLDVILLSVLATGFALLLSAAFGYDNYNDNLQRYYTEYEQLYGIDFNISDEEYLALGEEDRLRYADAYAKLNDDADVSRAFSIIIQLSLAIMSLSVLLAYMALEFAIPVLWLKNGQTIGKKIFGLAVMRTDSVRVKPITMLIRTLLGKYTIETMAPLLIIFLILFGSLGTVGLIMLAALALLQIVLIAATNNNAAIHDILAQTVVVDMESQMIFDSALEREARRREYAEADGARWGQ
ncbi:MAG: RDD family protein [Eubacteriales bacterium]|nr:RDD family protein [Christensenellaceae bacterium]MDY5717890.1 RDD family protein [Eubacteriales bacterium]